MELSLEFIEQRIKEQEEYIKELSTQYSKLPIIMNNGGKERIRLTDLIASAKDQLYYFWQKKREHPSQVEKQKIQDAEKAEIIRKTDALCGVSSIKTAYAQEFENIMKASTTIIH